MKKKATSKGRKRARVRALVRRRQAKAQSEEVSYLFNEMCPEKVGECSARRSEILDLIKEERVDLRESEKLRVERWKHNTKVHTGVLLVFVFVFSMPVLDNYMSHALVKALMALFALMGFCAAMLWLLEAWYLRISRSASHESINMMEKAIGVKPHSTQWKMKKRMMGRWRWLVYNYHFVLPTIFVFAWIVVPCLEYFLRDGVQHLLESGLIDQTKKVGGL